VQGIALIMVEQKKTPGGEKSVNAPLTAPKPLAT